MSLQSLRSLRLSGQKPVSIISIVVGERSGVEDSPSMVLIRPSDEPKLMDLRPLVGLWVAIYSKNADHNHLARLVDALESAKCRFFGVVTEGFVLPMTADHTPRHAELLAESWRDLCL